MSPGRRRRPDVALMAFALVGMYELVEHHGVLQLALFVAAWLVVDWVARRWVR